MTLIKYIFTIGILSILGGCTFSSSFQPGTTSNITASSIMIPVVEVKAAQGPTTLSLDFTQAIRDYYQTNSKLIVNSDQRSDLELFAVITTYSAEQINSTAQIGEQAEQMELTVVMKVNYVDNETPENSLPSVTVQQKTPYDAALTLEEAQVSLLPDIIEQMTQDVFNKTLARW